MLNKDSALSRVWTQAACASLEGGHTGDQATEAADIVALSWQARFSPADHLLGASISLALALRFFERSALVGRQVLVLDYTDVPPMAKIKDFSDHTAFHDRMVLIEWMEGPKPVDDPESWVRIEKLVMVGQLEPPSN